jgi:2-dehydropantoate 2-reductase
MSLKYAVIGTGALGGFYGGMLARAGKEVHFLLHSDYDHVRQFGIQIDSVISNFRLFPVNAYTTSIEMPVCDVVLVCLKTTKNVLLNSILPPLLHSNTVVILIQNGLGIEADLSIRFPNLYIAGGLAFICSNKLGPGHIAHLDYGKLNIGSYSDIPISIMNSILNDFRSAGVDADLVDLGLARWKKLVWNIPYNGLTVVLNTTTDELMKNKYTVLLIREIMLEVIHAANRMHLIEPIPETYSEEMLEMTRQMTPYSPSMKLDFDAGRPPEIKYIYSRPLEMAAEADSLMPCISMLEKQLRFMESVLVKKK